MERNRGFRARNPGSFNSRDRNDGFQKPWRSNFNTNQHNKIGNLNPWMQNNPQTLNPWQESRSNSDAIDPWMNNFNNMRQTNTAWSQQSNNNSNNGFWRQVSSGTINYNERQYNNQVNRDRRTPYERPNRGNRGGRPNRDRERQHDFPVETRREPSPDIEPEPVVLSPLEEKIEQLIKAVQSQPDNIGQLILLQSNNEIPPVLLNNAVHQVKNCTMVIDRNESTGYSKLRINSTVIAEGMYSSSKDAKAALYEMGLEILKSKCFYITSKSHYEEVSMNDINNQQKQESENTMDGSSKAVQMMLKMGWGGKGLGTKEQGEQKSVADKIVENISREGLGGSGKPIMQEVDKILADYAKSNKTITLGFDSGFTKDERAQIHAIAAKYHLKSKSEGGFSSRRITISKKMSKWVLIRELLSVGLENESYILTIPDEFEELWTKDD